MKYHLLLDKLLTQVESNSGFWIIHWGSFAMLGLGKGLWRGLSSHPRAGKTGGEIQTWSFPAWMPLGHPKEIAKSRMSFCRSNLTHCPLQSTAVFRHICACCPWLCPTRFPSSLTDSSANSGWPILVNESPNSSTWESFCTSWQVLEGDPVQSCSTASHDLKQPRCTNPKPCQVYFSEFV